MKFGGHLSMEESFSSNKKTFTVLSIDGGGIRGVIPGTLLAFLESKLQVLINVLLIIIISKIKYLTCS